MTASASKCIPDSSTPALKFYDYGNTLYNRAEELNNVPTESSNSDPNSLAPRNQLKTAVGDYGVNVGLIQTEINKALTGNGVNGTSLAATLGAAQENYFKRRKRGHLPNVDSCAKGRKFYPNPSKTLDATEALAENSHI